MLYFRLPYFHVSNSALFSTWYFSNLILYRRSLTLSISYLPYILITFRYTLYNLKAYNDLCIIRILIFLECVCPNKWIHVHRQRQKSEPIRTDWDLIVTRTIPVIRLVHRVCNIFHRNKVILHKWHQLNNIPTNPWSYILICRIKFRYVTPTTLMIAWRHGSAFRNTPPFWGGIWCI